MASRRLVQGRSRPSESATPAPRHQREDVENFELPPYEAPSCVLSANGRRALEELRTNNDYTKYEKHLKECKKTVERAAGDAHDKVYLRKMRLESDAEKRRKNGREENDKTQDEIQLETAAEQWQKRAIKVTADADSAMRDLIDYSDELAMHGAIIQSLLSDIHSTPARPPKRPRRARGGLDDDEAEEAEEEINEEPIPEPGSSAYSLLQKAKDDYRKKWAAKSMVSKYGDTNDYKGFKNTIHDALHQGEKNIPPLPKSKYWFPQDRTAANATGNTDGDNDSDDDEIIIAGTTTSLKCPLTLREFEVPYSNSECKHTFEKDTIITMIRESGTLYRATQEKQLKCPAHGCNAELRLSQFYEDHSILKQVQRARQQRQREEEEEDFDDEPHSSNNPRPTQLDSNSESDEEMHSRHTYAARIKRERQSQARGHESDAMDEGE